MNTNSNAVYFLSLSLENVRCFGDKQTLDLSDGNGKPARWTVILGDNGTGKTTLLQLLSGTQICVRNLIPSNQGEVLSLYEIQPNLLRILNNNKTQIEAIFYYGHTLTKNVACSNPITIGFDIGVNYSFTSTTKLITVANKLNKLNLYAYGANRNINRGTLTKELSKNTLSSLLFDHTELINAEEWILQTDYTASKESAIQTQTKKLLEQIIDVLINLLPEVTAITILTPTASYPKPAVGFKTPDCSSDKWLRLDALSLGYQTMISWMVDLAAHMFQRYPDSPNPIAEPAVVLIDEIDLHLHPKWQRTIMSYLSERFVNTQFIVTAHSPLIVQAAENANIAVLKREGDQVVIHQQPQDVKGWRIDQLLTSDLFDLPSARSPHYEALLERRRQILSKAELTKDDQAELKQLEEEIGDLPTAETAEDIEAMDIIRRAAKLLKPET